LKVVQQQPIPVSSTKSDGPKACKIEKPGKKTASVIENQKTADLHQGK